MGWKKIRSAGTDHEHLPAPAPCFVKRGGIEHFITVAYPAKNEACPIASVACDADTFAITLADGSVHTFEKNDPAFKTVGTAERLANGETLI